MDYVAQFLDILNTHASKSVSGMAYEFTAMKGKKFTRIVSEYVYTDGQRGGRSSHAFIDHATGEIYKCAGWKAPAKGVRFTLPADAEKLKTVVDPFTSYLYK